MDPNRDHPDPDLSWVPLKPRLEVSRILIGNQHAFSLIDYQDSMKMVRARWGPEAPRARDWDFSNARLPNWELINAVLTTHGDESAETRDEKDRDFFEMTSIFSNRNFWMAVAFDSSGYPTCDMPKFQREVLGRPPDSQEISKWQWWATNPDNTSRGNIPTPPEIEINTRSTLQDVRVCFLRENLRQSRMDEYQGNYKHDLCTNPEFMIPFVLRCRPVWWTNQSGLMPSLLNVHNPNRPELVVVDSHYTIHREGVHKYLAEWVVNGGLLVMIPLTAHRTDEVAALSVYNDFFKLLEELAVAVGEEARTPWQLFDEPYILSEEEIHSARLDVAQEPLARLLNEPARRQPEVNTKLLALQTQVQPRNPDAIDDGHFKTCADPYLSPQVRFAAPWPVSNPRIGDSILYRTAKYEKKDVSLKPTVLWSKFGKGRVGWLGDVTLSPQVLYILAAMMATAGSVRREMKEGA